MSQRRVGWSVAIFLSVTCVGLMAISQEVAADVETTPNETRNVLVELVHDNWGQWRGPLGTGVAPHATPPLEWSEDQNVLWKTKIPGKGHSTPIVWGDRVFVTTAVPYGPEFEAQPDRAPGAHDNVGVTQQHKYLVIALNRIDGEILWQTVVADQVPHEGGHRSGSQASNSPATDGERVYAFFGSRGLYCLDFNGKVIWSKSLGRMNSKHAHGEGSSPALFDKTLVVNWDQEGGSFIIALDTQDGRERWKLKREEETSWSSPIIVNHEGRPQVIVSATNRIRSYDLTTGALIWECGGLSSNVVASPVSDGEYVYAGSSYETRSMMAIRLKGARGDVTGSDQIVWTIHRGTPYVPSPLLYDGQVYFLRHYQGILTRMEGATGTQLMDSVRLGRMDEIYSSLVGADDRIYITDRMGLTAVLSHRDFPKVLGLNKLDETISASAAIAGNQLFIRGDQSLYCLMDKSKKE